MSFWKWLGFFQRKNSPPPTLLWHHHTRTPGIMINGLKKPESSLFSQVSVFLANIFEKNLYSYYNVKQKSTPPPKLWHHPTPGNHDMNKPESTLSEEIPLFWPNGFENVLKDFYLYIPIKNSNPALHCGLLYPRGS